MVHNKCGTRPANLGRLKINAQVVEGPLSNRVGAFEISARWQVVIENETAQGRGSDR